MCDVLQDCKPGGGRRVAIRVDSSATVVMRHCKHEGQESSHRSEQEEKERRLRCATLHPSKSVHMSMNITTLRTCSMQCHTLNHEKKDKKV